MTKIITLYNKFLAKYLELEEKIFYKRFFILLAITLFYYFPFFTNDIPFIDDYARRTESYSTEYELGRPFASTIVSVFSFKSQIGLNAIASFIETSPLNQLLSVLILCLASIIYCTRVFKIKNSFHTITISFILIANPFFYETFSYTNDSIIFISASAIALISSIFSLKNRLLEAILGSLLVCLFLGIYQVNINLFFASILMIFLLEVEKNEPNAYLNLFINISKGLLGMVIYQLLIIPQIHYLRPYFYIHSKLINFDNQIFSKILNNIVIYYTQTISAFFETKIITIFCIIGILLFIFLFIRSSTNKVHGLIISFLSISGIIFFIFGPLLMKERILSMPRQYPSFSIFITLIYYSYFKVLNNQKQLFDLMNYILLLFFFTFSYSYKEILVDQNRFNNLYYQLITSDLASLGFKETNTLLFKGGFGLSPSTFNSFTKNRSLSHFHSGNISDAWHCKVMFILKGFKAKFLRYDEEISDEVFNRICHSTTLIKNPMYKILQDGDTYLVTFPGDPCY